MTIEDFTRAAATSDPPSSLNGPLRALWLEARGQWDAAHRVVQDVDTDAAAWVHAYLHRKEGDEGNAGYWYRRARRPHARTTHEEEWREIACALLG